MRTTLPEAAKSLSTVAARSCALDIVNAKSLHLRSASHCVCAQETAK